MSKCNFYLVISSTFFLMPTLYGLYRRHTILPIVSLLAMIASINYWLDTTNEHKKNIDLISSKCCCLIYFIYGYQIIKSIPMRFIGYTNIFIVLSTYNASCIMYNIENSNKWISFHIMFHFMASIAKMFILSQ